MNLAYLRRVWPECETIMRYSAETSNRLMVHLARLINSYVEVQKASSNVGKACFPIAETPDNLWSVDHFTGWFTSAVAGPSSFTGTLRVFFFVFFCWEGQFTQLRSRKPQITLLQRKHILSVAGWAYIFLPFMTSQRDDAQLWWKTVHSTESK